MHNEDDIVPQNDYGSEWIVRPHLIASESSFHPLGLLRDLNEGIGARFPSSEFNTGQISNGDLPTLLSCSKKSSSNNSNSDSSDFAPPKLSNTASDESTQMMSSYEFGGEMTPVNHNANNLVNTKSLDESKNSGVRLTVVRQPELQHRARYLSEGSRGAIKDRSGSSNCTVQLVGYHRATRVQLIAVPGITHECYPNGPNLMPHPSYRLIPVSGKTANASSCQKATTEEGMECVEIMLYPENNMTAILDCIGILKICTYDTKHRKRKSPHSPGNTVGGIGGVENSTQNNSVRIFMRAHIPNDTYGGFYTIHAITDSISCVQQLGVPEVYKMSLSRASARGGDELFIIGRNFDRNTKILFREYKEDGTLKWNTEAQIDKQYLHQCHIVCTIPPYFNMRQGGEVSITVICSTKSSHPQTFFYTSCDEDDDWRPPASPQLSLNSSFCLPDYEVENHRDFSLLERNCRPSSFYSGSDGGAKVRQIPALDDHCSRQRQQSQHRQQLCDENTSGGTIDSNTISLTDATRHSNFQHIITSNTIYSSANLYDKGLTFQK